MILVQRDSPLESNLQAASDLTEAACIGSLTGCGFIGPSIQWFSLALRSTRVLVQLTIPEEVSWFYKKSLSYQN